MKPAVILLCILFLNLFIGILQADTLPENTTKGYHSWLPASDATQAMLIGNGTMGSMVYGHPHAETIIMSHAALYLPLRPPLKPIRQAERLSEIRQLILDGNGSEAAKIPVEQSIADGYDGQIWSDPYIPAFDILINTSPANIEKYKRSVNFETGEAIVSWQQNGKKFERRQFISRGDSILVVKINSDTLFDVDFTFKQRPVNWNEWDYINSNIKNTSSYAKGNHLYYQTEFVHQWDGNIAGYEGVGKVISRSGLTRTNGNLVSVNNTNEVMLLVKIVPHLTGDSFQTQETEAYLDNFKSDYTLLLESHKEIHTSIFNRVTLDLNGSDADKELTSEVMMQTAKERSSTAFVEKQFYASRYNILSATGTNPPNLQGIWGISWQPPWSSDYTNDGNLPVAISSFLCSNMPELMGSYFNYNNQRIPYYQDNAKVLYGCRGIQVPSHSSSHGWNDHFDPTWCLTFWNGGAAWAAHFYYDYWLYTNDGKFLAEQAYPFMKETALFYEDFLTLDGKNKYRFNPSYSPENNPGNNPSQATLNSTMDVMLANELFRNLITAGKVMNEEEAQLKKWEDMLAAIPGYEVDSTGELREWIWDGYTNNPHHRHSSQLYGMYDIMDSEIIENEELLNGVRLALENRMKDRRKEHGGIMVFGLVQMAWVAANLGDAALVEEIINWLSSQYWSNSLATFHDPNGLFNMDLSGGFQTVIIRSLVYSDPGFISVLPAAPLSWKTGTIKGLLARNQVNIEELSWAPEAVHLRINSPLAQKITIKFPQKFDQLSIEGDSAKLIKNTSHENMALIYLPKNESVTITIKP
ncbi:MAG: alpha-L-fucosidase [Bacteroidetes bacterium CG_4_9_14_3_um_filter_41_19]|nr:MAG: alpha-L-fucosidase [Bacteroidetes bacterium CG_4_9_14_3_um_filter_41_19]